MHDFSLSNAELTGSESRHAKEPRSFLETGFQ
jgi:hypothetical protein